MLPTLLGHPQKQKKHEYLYWEFHEQGKKQAVRMGRWKGVRQNVARNPDGYIELYDLENDIGEKNDIAEQHGEVVARIAEIMRKAHAPSHYWKMPWD